MNRALFCKRLVLLSLAVLPIIVWQACSGCNPVTLKTIDLSPTDFATGTSGIAGSIGFCLSAGNPPPSSFSPGNGQVLVGFDDFFKPGSDPFPCNDVRDTIFRAGVQFDVSRFDSIVGANFLFDTDSSIDRSGGETTGQNPPKSVATTIGLGTQAFSAAFPDDDEASLPAGPNIDVGMSSQVREWITKAHSNHGFVIWGPRPPIGPGTPPEDNDAQLSFYSNFRLRIVYNPAQNPRAPQ
jgi:hypothetical protein